MTSLLKAAPKVLPTNAAMIEAVASSLADEHHDNLILPRCVQMEPKRC